MEILGGEPIKRYWISKVNFVPTGQLPNPSSKLRGRNQTMRLKLNHIGLVVRNVSEFAEIFRHLGLSEMAEPEPDPVQKVLACFFSAGKGEKTHIELLEPTDENSPISNFLKKRGGGLHHLCFEVDDIEKAKEEFIQKGFRMVSEPVECIGYDRSFKDTCGAGTKIAFFLISDKILIEILEKGHGESPLEHTGLP